MNQQQLGWKGHREALTFDFAWAYLVSMAAALAGLFLPFAQQQYGCPHDAACLLIAALSQPSLVGGQAGPALLGVVSGALLLALFSLVRPQRPLFLVGLALSLTTLALVSFDAATAGSWIFKLRISGESDHPFRLNPTTCFGGIRPGVSVESDHPFR